MNSGFKTKDGSDRPFFFFLFLVLTRYVHLPAVGHLKSVPEFKREDHRLLAWYPLQLEKAGVKVHLNTEIKPEALDISDELHGSRTSTPVILQNEAMLYTQFFQFNEENRANEWDDKNYTGCISVIAMGSKM